jgi:tyrosyl-DNA phosphodiesterase 2
MPSTTIPLPLLKATLPDEFQSLDICSYDKKKSAWLPHKRDSSVLQPLESRSIGVLTWNIEMSTPQPSLRLSEILIYIENLLVPSPNSSSRSPTIILIQELDYTCFSSLLSNKFVRGMYAITDTSPKSWRGYSYGTVTLVPKTLAGYVASVFRTPFGFKPPIPSTVMGRDALYVDLEIPSPQQDLSDPSIEKLSHIRIRIANTHLESLDGHGDRARPVQLRSISEYISCDGIKGGIVGGDMNPISAPDFNLVEEVGLTDAWKDKMGYKVEQDIWQEGAEGHTWGYQPPCYYPPRRMDKILFLGDFLKVDDMERIGVGLESKSEPDYGSSASWVSDHYGLLAKFTLG